MKTVNTWFKESIERYQQFTAKSSELKENVMNLPLAELLQRCAVLKQQQESFLDQDEKLQQIISFIGPDILENPLLGHYQHALDLAITETDLLAAKTQLRKDLLVEKIDQILTLKKDSSIYRTGIKEYNSMVQQNNRC